MPYTSRDEITTAVNHVVEKYEAGEIDLEWVFHVRYPCSILANAKVRNITESEIASHLEIHAKGSPPLDLMIRTSGVKRFSDYMLWQV